MRPLLTNFSGNFGIDIIYSFVIIVCSLMVYFGTKELYDLSGHKGIKYFRQAFLFFAFAYFFRSFIKFICIYSNIPVVFELNLRIIGTLSMFLFMYFSAMAVFYLLYSVMWKKWNHGSKVVNMFHVLALIIAVVSVLFRSRLVHLGINVILFIFIMFVVLVSYANSKHKKKNSDLYVIYILLFVFWMFNIIDVLIPNFLKLYQLSIYLSSIMIFLLILYKVLKNTGSD